MNLSRPLLVFFSVIFLFAIIFGAVKGFTTETFLMIKPTSLIQISGFFIWAFILTNVTPLKLLSKENRSIITILLFIVLMLSLYEVMWGFHYWFSLYGITRTSVDTIETPSFTINPFTNERVSPYNLNVFTKVYMGVFMLCVYSLYVIRREHE